MDRKPVRHREFSSSRRFATSSSSASDPYHTSHRIPRTNSTNTISTTSGITRNDVHTTNHVMNSKTRRMLINR